MTTLSAGLIVKDEEKNIHTTLNSLLHNNIPIIHNLIIVDTGSKDNTKEVIEKWCNLNKVKCYMKDIEWIDDFSHARNQLLKFADTLTDWIVLLDASDELKNAFYLKEALKVDKHRLSKIIGFNVKQQWQIAHEKVEYLNVRLIRTKSKWKYHEKVHEYIFSPLLKQKDKYKLANLNDVIVYQNRDTDNGKTTKRLERDKNVLLEEINNNPKNKRAYFYLGQTYKCMHDYPNAFKYYNMRSQMGGFLEEVYQSYFNCAVLFKMSLMYNQSKENNDFIWSQALYFFDKSLCVFDELYRVEPLLEMTEYYIKFEKYDIAFEYCKKAIEQPYPIKHVLFVSRNSYDKFRYELMIKILDVIGKEKHKELYEMCKSKLNYLVSIS